MWSRLFLGVLRCREQFSFRNYLNITIKSVQSPCWALDLPDSNRMKTATGNNNINTSEAVIWRRLLLLLLRGVFNVTMVQDSSAQFKWQSSASQCMTHDSLLGAYLCALSDFWSADRSAACKLASLLVSSQYPLWVITPVNRSKVRSIVWIILFEK